MQDPARISLGLLWVEVAAVEVAAVAVAAAAVAAAAEAEAEPGDPPATSQTWLGGPAEGSNRRGFVVRLVKPNLVGWCVRVRKAAAGFGEGKTTQRYRGHLVRMEKAS